MPDNQQEADKELIERLRLALEHARGLSCGQIGDTKYDTKQRLDDTHDFLRRLLNEVLPAAHLEALTANGQAPREIDGFKQPYVDAGHDVESLFTNPYNCSRCGAAQIDLSEDQVYGGMRKCTASQALDRQDWLEKFREELATYPINGSLSNGSLANYFDGILAALSRSSTPSDEMVEAAARAISPTLFRRLDDEVGPATLYEREKLRGYARAALSSVLPYKEEGE